MDEPSVMTAAVTETAAAEPSAPASDAMAEFYQLRRELIVTTGILTAIAFPLVWGFYGLNIALNYLLGAITGVVYLRLLAKNVEKLGNDSSNIGKSQGAVFLGVMIFATQLEQLHVLPVFLGFLTFKATLLVYTLRVLTSSTAD
jgi:ATP synthase protein I